MAKAILIKTTGDILVVNPSSLEEYRALVGGDIESINLDFGHSAFINEDGIALALPLNSTANFVVIAMGFTPLPGDFIKGDMLLVGPADSEGETTDVTPQLLRMFGLI